MAGSSQKESDRCWCLRRSGMHAEWLLLENNTEVTIGRGLGLTYQLVSKKCPLMVSRTHCFLRQNEEGHWTITDNKSLNGVYLNKERLAPLKAYPIREGDQIQLGVPLEDGERAEYEYELIHDERGKLEPFLTDQLKSKMKCHRTKRKFSAHELDTSGAEGSSNSKSKALRVSWDGEQPSMPSQRAELVKQPTENMGSKLPAPGPSILNASQADCRAQEKEVLLGTQVFETVVPFGTQTGLKSTLHDKGMKSANSAPSRSTVQLSKVRETMQEIRKLKMRVQEKQTAVLSVKQQNKKRAQKEVREMERELQELHDQLRNEQEQQLQRVKQLEKTFFEEEKQMEGGSSSEGDDSLKDQLAQALQEHTLLMEELNRSKKDFEQIIQAKNKELQATMEEKEKVQAQKEEALNQMNIVLDNELQCIICSEHFIEAVTLNCAHSFCSYCIKEWIKRKVECPICRQEIVTQTRSLVLDNCIERMMENLSHEMKQHRLALIKQRKDDKGTTGSQIAQQKQESDVRRPLDPLDAIAEERIEGEEGHSIAGTARRENPGPTLRPVPLLGDASIASFNMPDDDEYYNEAHDYDGPYSSDQDYDYENPDPTLSPATLLSDASIASFNMPDDDEYYNEAHDYDGPYSSDQDYDYENPEPTVSPATLLSDASIASFNMADDDDEQYYNETHDYDGPYSSDEDDDDFIFLSTHW
ncbi:E3 ubiquitin-protein ligase RNF8 isoform X5 [Pleurodeles waltl]|uniref:E3 ubiquitin-protein ligase RNF8 isoform X5 n=1 Tax=Pleurodeles waltl TaxID=8319 RepID=UPI00370938DE